MTVSMNAYKKPLTTLLACCVVFLLAMSIGCQNGPMSGRMQQYQLENERLLTEFRSQKKENEQLRADRTRLLVQQAETEKLAAKLQSQLSGNKTLTAQLPAGRSNLGSAGARTVGERSPFDNLQPSDRLSQTPSNARLDSSTRNSRSAQNEDALQWRPIRKEMR